MILKNLYKSFSFFKKYNIICLSNFKIGKGVQKCQVTRKKRKI